MAITPRELQARRALLRSAGRRHRRSAKIPRLREPRRFLLRYQRWLTEQRLALEEQLERQLYPVLPALLQRAELDRGGVRTDSARDELGAIFSGMGVIFRTLYSPEQIQAELTGNASDLAGFQGQEHQRQVVAALGVPIIQPEPFLAPVIAGFVRDNIALVRTLQGEQLTKLEIIVSSGMRLGDRVETIRDDIQEWLGVSKSRASFLARDQIGKLYGELAQHRQQNVGVEEYDWDTSQDERVRPGHRILHGTRQRWDSPPVVDARSGRQAHPGGDYQCRCQGIPVFPMELLRPLRPSPIPGLALAGAVTALLSGASEDDDIF